MKTSAIPSVRVAPELRDQLEALLEEGESLSAFVEASLRESVRRRQDQAEFVARGLASLAAVRDGERTTSPAVLLRRLEQRLAKARAHRER